MTLTKIYIAAMFLIVVVIAVDVDRAEYADYDGGSNTDSEGNGSRDLYDAPRQSDNLNNQKLWNIPLQHLMVRKSQRSPSLRLRFGRRSDPSLANDISNLFLGQDNEVERKSVRSPSFRLRFGRRNEPEIPEEFMVRKSSRSPSFRLRFGRRSDPLMTNDLTSSYYEDNYLDKKVVRSAPSYRLRFGRQSDSHVAAAAAAATSTEDLSGTSSENGSPTSGRVGDN